MGQGSPASSLVDSSSFKDVVGVDIGSQMCRLCVLRPDTSQVIKPIAFANAPAGLSQLVDKLEPLGVPCADPDWSGGHFAL